MQPTSPGLKRMEEVLSEIKKLFEETQQINRSIDLPTASESIENLNSRLIALDLLTNRAHGINDRIIQIKEKLADPGVANYESERPKCPLEEENEAIEREIVQMLAECERIEQDRREVRAESNRLKANRVELERQKEQLKAEIQLMEEEKARLDLEIAEDEEKLQARKAEKAQRAELMDDIEGYADDYQFFEQQRKYVFDYNRGPMKELENEWRTKLADAEAKRDALKKEVRKMREKSRKDQAKRALQIKNVHNSMRSRQNNQKALNSKDVASPPRASKALSPNREYRCVARGSRALSPMVLKSESSPSESRDVTSPSSETTESPEPPKEPSSIPLVVAASTSAGPKKPELFNQGKNYGTGRKSNSRGRRSLGNFPPVD